MPENISWGVQVQVADGPKLSASRIEEVHAYDKIEVEIPAITGTTPGTATVEVQPGTTAGKIKFLMIKSSIYDPELTYKVNVDTNPDIALDRLHLLIGSGAIALLGAVPTSLIFANALAEPAAIEILVGRDAI